MKKKVQPQAKIAPPEKGFWLNGKLAVLFLIAACVLIYLPTFWYGFSPMDERWLIFKQQEMMSHLSNMPTLFKSSMMGMYYRPICMSSFMLDLVMGNGSAFIFHFTNVLLHVLCTVLLYRFLIQINLSRNFAFFALLIFAVHPINVHTVAWIPGRNDSLLCLFTLLSCSLLLSYFKTKKIHHFILHLLVFGLALFTKENAIVLPVIYFLLWFVFAKTENKKSILVPALSWLIVGIVWFLLRKHFVDYLPPAYYGSFGRSLWFFLEALISYSGKIFLPIEQSVLPNLRDMSIIPFLIVVLALAILAFKVGFENKKIAFFGLAWFYIFLAIPAWTGATSTNADQYEHRIYTSLIGAFIFLSQLKITINPTTVKRLALVVIIVFSTKTVLRCNVYKNEFSYAKAATVEAPSIALFHDMLGYMYVEKNEFGKAIENFNVAIDLDPHRTEFYNNRGYAYFEIKDYQHALEDDNKALELRKSQPETMINRSMANFFLGNHQAALQDLEMGRQMGASNIERRYVTDLFTAIEKDTIVMYNQMLEKDSLNASLYNERGIAKMKLKLFQQAFDDFDRAEMLNPASEAIRKNRQIALSNLANKRQ